MEVVIAHKQEALLALRVVTTMQRRNLTIPKLAKAAGVPLNTLQKICKGRGKQSSIWTLSALAQALSVSTDYLLGLKETP